METIASDGNVPEFEKRLVLINEISEIDKLHDFIDNLGEELNISTEIIMNINLAMEEAVSNVILYAYQGRKDQNIYINCTKNKDVLTFTIIDSGIPFDPTSKDNPDISLPASERPIGGLGIYLMRQIMTNISYARIDNNNVFTLTKNIGNLKLRDGN